MAASPRLSSMDNDSLACRLSKAVDASVGLGGLVGVDFEVRNAERYCR